MLSSRPALPSKWLLPRYTAHIDRHWQSGYYTPPLYEPTTYKILEKASFINATHFQITTTCKGCTKWGDEDMGYTEVDVSQDVTFGYAFSSNPVDAPEDSESSFAIHDGVGHPIFDLSVGKNDDFAAKVAAAL